MTHRHLTVVTERLESENCTTTESSPSELIYKLTDVVLIISLFCLPLFPPTLPHNSQSVDEASLLDIVSNTGFRPIVPKPKPLLDRCFP